MPARLVITLRPTAQAPRGDDGPAVQAAFLDSVRLTAPLLADHLHAPSAYRPYCVTQTRIADGAVRFEIGVLHDGLVETVVVALDEAMSDRLALRQRPYVVERGDVYVLPYAELRDRSTASGTWEVTFRSPTAFRVPGATREKPARVLSFPDPGLVLHRLAQRLTMYSEEAATSPVDAWLDRVVVSSFELRTKLHLVKAQSRVTLPGAVGWARYELLAGSPEHAAAFGALFEFANFAGIGDGTTKGMGDVRCRAVPKGPRNTGVPGHSVLDELVSVAGRTR